MNWIFITIISSLISGILGVIISIVYHKIAEERSLKFETLRNLFGYKHQLSLGVGQRNEFNKALNEVPIVFYKSKEVVKAHKNMYEIMTNQQPGEPGRDKLVEDKLISLYKSILKDLGMDIEKYLNDADLLKTIN